MSGNGSVVIDGVCYSGNTISINNGRVVIDGAQQDQNLVGPISVEVNGDIERLNTSSGNIKAKRVGSINTTSGDIECTDVTGNIKTVSGDIECASVFGGISTISGDIRHR